MGIVVEDGTGVEDANSYASVDFADLYFEDRGNAVWEALDDDVKEQCLIRATDYVDGRFTFLGEKNDEDQALQFPRDDAETIPVKLQRAVCEYALRAASAPLAPDPTVSETGLQVVSKREKLGPIEEETTYAESRSVMVFKPYPAADMLLRGLVDTVRRVIR